MGYKHYSLLGDLIPSHRCIVDILHMKLRIIVNVLLQQLSLELIYLDNFKITQTLDKEKNINIVSYFDFFNKVKIKVGFSNIKYLRYFDNKKFNFLGNFIMDWPLN
jgi:hypothetical protein